VQIQAVETTKKETDRRKKKKHEKNVKSQNVKKINEACFVFKQLIRQTELRTATSKKRDTTEVEAEANNQTESGGSRGK
jgi:hypothetical protein